MSACPRYGDCQWFMPAGHGEILQVGMSYHDPLTLAFVTLAGTGYTLNPRISGIPSIFVIDPPNASASWHEVTVSHLHRPHRQRHSLNNSLPLPASALSAGQGDVSQSHHGGDSLDSLQDTEAQESVVFFPDFLIFPDGKQVHYLAGDRRAAMAPLLAAEHHSTLAWPSFK